MKTETETCTGNDLSRFEKLITKEKFSLQEAKTLQNNSICYANSKTKTIILKYLQQKNRNTEIKGQRDDLKFPAN